MEALVAKYKKAWETHDIRMLAELFTDDAVYVEKEDEKPFCGLDEICDYWRTNAAQQRHVAFRPLKTDIKDNALEVRWECRFYRNDLMKWLCLEGHFRALIRDGRIYHFTEKFEKRLSESPE